MGLLRLMVPPSIELPLQIAERAYLTGTDQIPWACRTQFRDGILTIERSLNESGKLHVPWPVPGRGELTLTTATLLEREAPYQLAVELARSKLNTVRCLALDWRAAGLAVTPAVEATISRATQHFIEAVTHQHEPELAAEQAQQSIAAALEAADLLVDGYVEQAFSLNRGKIKKRKLLYGVNLGGRKIEQPLGERLERAFNTAVVPLVWREAEATEGSYDWRTYDQQIEWCGQHGFTVFGGPLLSLNRRALPDWLYLWEGDFPNLLAFASDYLETAVARYRGKVQVWNCAARINGNNMLSLGDEERLRLTVRAVEIAHQVDPQTPALICFDQPWAEYMGHGDGDWELSPIQFADHLVRAGLPLAGIGLELNVGYYPGGTGLRDRIELGRCIDMWSLLETPLFLMITVPGGPKAPTDASAQVTPQSEPHGAAWTTEAQRDWVKHFVPWIMTRPAVHGILWNRLYDKDCHEFPNGGLIDLRGKTKPAFRSLTNLREKLVG